MFVTKKTTFILELEPFEANTVKRALRAYLRGLFPEGDEPPSFVAKALLLQMEALA